jgi:Flp pilus assembly protein TadD
MSRNPSCLAPLLAAGLGLTLLAAAPASAWPFGGANATPSSTPATGKQATPTTPPAPQKASPEQRAAAQRLEPLARAAFWQHEANIDPKDSEAGIGLASALRALGRNDEAADAAERVLLFAPKSEDALLESARAHIASGHGFYAIAPLKQAETLYPKDWRPASLLAVAMEQDERPDEAVLAYNRAMKLSPGNPAVLSNFGLFYTTHGDAATGEALLRQAAAQPGATAQERQNLALVLGLKGQLAEAERLIREDLPPETADADLAYLKAADSRHGVVATPGSQAAAQAVAAKSDTGRTWGSVQQ